MEGEDHEALFHSYPCELYYVQSPSTLSHTTSAADCRNINESAYEYHSPVRSENFIINNPINNRSITLSRYSSRGSNNSFLQEKKIVYDLQSNGNATENGEEEMMKCRIINVEQDHVVKEDAGDNDYYQEEEDDEVYYYGNNGGWWKYFTFRTSSSSLWISLQISWRLVVSLGVALLVFYIATKPPPPKMSIKMAGIRQFGLGEGVDATGIPTKILTCNCSIDLVIDNKSKIFGLHIQPPLTEISFGHLPFAISYGPALYAESHGSSLFQLYVGTKNKPMYGAGRSMEDMLESGQGLPLVIRVSFTSTFRVVWNLIQPKFHRQAQCLLILDTAYDKKHQTQAYNSTCIVTS